MKKLNVFDNFRFVLIPGIAIVSFSQFLVVLFGQTIPNTFLSFFKEASFAIILAVAFIFAITWFWRTIPHNRPKNYSIISFDVFGQESRIDGLRTEFKTHDVAWNFMKQYKKSYPLYGFALVSDPPKSDKKTILKYL
ncbi:MAG: hypothetical protein IH791_00755 [Thaumarchaeota archaeon]|nr:hypothetical protein [Nitrososphaerota archaeon]